MKNSSLWRRWFQFRLRTLMLALLIFPIGLGWLAQARSKSQQAWANVDEIRNECDTFGAFDRSAGPRWQQALGIDSPGDIEELKLGFHYFDKNRQSKTLARLRAFQHIKKLTIYSSRCSPAGLAPLADLPRLEKLELSAADSNSMPERVGDSSSREPFLNRSISLIGKAGFDTALAIPTLEELVVVGIPFDLTDPVAAVKLKRLRRLHIESPAGVVATSASLELSQIANLTELERLQIGCHSVSEDGLSQLRQLKKLKQLSLDNWTMPESGLDSLAEIPSLEELRLRQLPVTDEEIQSLAQLKNLRRLNIKQSRITEKGLSILSGLANLEELELGSSDTTAVGLHSLTRLKKLRHLALKHQPLTDEDLSEIASIPTLEALTLETFILTDEDGNQKSAHTVEGFKELAKLKRLKRLVLCHWKFADDELAKLAMLPSLESLGLVGMQGGSEDTSQLRQARPSLDIFGESSFCGLSF